MIWPQGEGTKEVGAALSASVRFIHDAELPDVLSLADLAGRPDLTAEVLVARRCDGREHGRPHRFRYPKPGTAYRDLMTLDPYARLDFRLRLGPIARTIDEALNDGVFRTRTVGDGPEWACRDWRQEFQRFREERGRARHSGVWGYEVMADVRNHYATVTTGHLSSVLASCCCDDYLVDPVVGWLNGLADIPGLPAGLPVADEAAGPLGTIALRPVDLLLRRLGVHFLRWSDDYRLYVLATADPEAILAEVGDQLGRGGQELNDSKSRICALSDPINGGEGQVSDGPLTGPDRPESFGVLAALGVSDGITRALGLLRKAQSPSGVRTLLRHPWVLERFPKESVTYLQAVRGLISASEWQAFAELLPEPTTTANASSQLHLARLFRSHPLPSDLGRGVFERAASLTSGAFGPTKAHLLLAAGHSAERVGVKRRRALELADSLSDLDAKRALVASSVLGGGINLTARKGLAHLLRHDRDLLPTVEIALAS